MWVKFDIDGMKINFQITNYIPDQDIEGRWTKVSANFEFQNVIKYDIENQEDLLCYEVDRLRDDIAKLLDDKVERAENISFIEPDFEMTLYPKYNLKDNSHVIYIQEGKEIQDVYADVQVNLWNNGLTCVNFGFTLDRDDLEILYKYLCLVSKTISKDKVQNLIEQGIIYGED